MYLYIAFVSTFTVSRFKKKKKRFVTLSGINFKHSLLLVSENRALTQSVSVCGCWEKERTVLSLKEHTTNTHL